MYAGQLLFAQLMDFLPRHEFNTCVRRYHGDRRPRGFSCRDQFLCLAFAQLTFRESLRDIATCLRAHQAKLYHLGIRGNIARSTLADANEQRDWRIHADFALRLIQTARKLSTNDHFDRFQMHTQLQLRAPLKIEVPVRRRDAPRIYQTRKCLIN